MGRDKTETALERVILRMTESAEPHAVLTEITHGLVDELDAALARIWLIEDDDGAHATSVGDAARVAASSLRLVASAGLSENLAGGHSRIAMGALKIGAIAATRERVSTNDLAGDPRIEDKAWVQREGLRSFAGYALAFRGELLGVLGMFARRELTVAEVDRLGAFAAHASVAIKNARMIEELSRLSRKLENENAYLKEEIREAQPTEIVGTSPALSRALGELARVAPTATTVLLLGETGTGKELFARELHAQSPRRHGPLVRVNLAAVSPTLIESELFGHEKGAFTGAVQRRVGRFELADGGTLFLDEVGELPLEAQVKLLRVLQEREFERIGGTRPLRVDVRVVCATNRDLGIAMREQRFRADLFYRLNVFPITVPPLRDRREDIPLLVKAFLASFAARLGRAIVAVDEPVMRHLVAYDWPGNVRELHNVLERAAVLAREPHLTLEDIPDLGVVPSGDAPSRSEGTRTEPAELTLRQRVDAYERALIAEALQRSGGNQSEAARLLRTSRATLQYKMKVLGL